MIYYSPKKYKASKYQYKVRRDDATQSSKCSFILIQSIAPYNISISNLITSKIQK